MSPRPTLAHVRRPAILAAAAAVISERGLAGTRISDVAARAGTSAPGVLYWFASRDELLAEALTFADDRFYASLTGELAGLPSATARLERLDRRWRDEIAAIVREGQAIGEFGPADPDQLALVLGALMDGFAIQVALGDPAVRPAQVREHCMALVRAQLGKAATRRVA